MPQTITIRGDNLTADLLLWRIHGVRGQELIEEMMEVNPGLAELGAVSWHDKLKDGIEGGGV